MRTCEIIQIDTDTAEALLDAAMESAGSMGPLLESEASAIQAVNAAADIARLFPDEVQEASAAFSMRGNMAGALALRGVPVPHEMRTTLPTEHGNLTNHRAAKASGILALASAALLGSPISYKTNPRGHLPTLITQVTPLQQNPYKHLHGAVRSGASTSWHSESVATQPDRRIQFLSLFCVRAQEGVRTRVLPGDVVDQSLPFKDRIALRKYEFMLPELIIPGSEKNPRPILHDTPRGTAVIYGGVHINTTPDAFTKTTLERLRSRLDELDDQATVHELQTGDVLFIDNAGLHTRDAFEPSWPHPRWQMRTFTGSPDSPLFVDPSEA